MEKNAKIYVAGHKGMAGSAIYRNLISKGFTNIVTKTHKELDLTDQKNVLRFFEDERPEYVFIAAAKVGGILANNTYKADFIYQNMMIQNNVIHSAYLTEVKKLVFLGSSCIYPRMATQPMKEEELLTGTLEPTNESYAIAKIAGIKMCDAYRSQYGCNFISVMPTNLYGEEDNYDLKSSHVLPAIISKMDYAKRNGLENVELWGTGMPLREFMHADDMADATVFCMENYNDYGHINIGSGEELSIKELALLVKKIVGYNGEIIWNSDYPDGTPRKLMDSSKLFKLGWKPKIKIEEGVTSIYNKLNCL